jgi:hypothetical protein
MGYFSLILKQKNENTLRPKGTFDEKQKALVS